MGILMSSSKEHDLFRANANWNYAVCRTPQTKEDKHDRVRHVPLRFSCVRLM